MEERKTIPGLGRNNAVHVHTFDSVLDAVNTKKRIIDKIAANGGDAVAITDHGVLFSALDDLDYAKSKGVKIIYGVEAYVLVTINEKTNLTKRIHLILMGINEEGVHAIDRAVTESNKNLAGGFPCMTMEMLVKFFGPGSKGYGNVIATSACVQGIGGTILFSNEITLHEIGKLQKKIDRLKNSSKKNKKDGTQIFFDFDKLASCEKEISEIGVSLTLAERKSISLNGIPKKTPEDKKEIEENKAEIKSYKAIIKEKTAYVSMFSQTRDSYVELSNKVDILKNSLYDESVLYERAKKELIDLKEIFGSDNFYIEVQYHYLNGEKKIMPKLVSIAKEINTPLVAANDAHLINGTKEEVQARKIAKFLRFGKIFDKDADMEYFKNSDSEDEDVIDEKTENEDENEEVVDEEVVYEQVMSAPSDGYTFWDIDSSLYLKTDEELYNTLSLILSEEDALLAVSNISVITDRCEGFKCTDKKYYPVYNRNINAEEYLRELVEAGIKKRFPVSEKFTQVYRDRIEYEMGIITSMGYSNYHLIVQEYMKVGKILGEIPDDELQNAPLTSLEELTEWFEEKKKIDPRFGLGIGTGEGRGSAAGSLVCYVLEITGIDPIEYNLLFERFLNPARVSMPDIDSDFSPKIREKVMRFIINKYGTEAVCCILTKSMSGLKGGIRDAGRYLDTLYSRFDKKYVNKADEICKKITPVIQYMDKVNEKFVAAEELFAKDKDALTIINMSRNFLGAVKSVSMHPAGIIIAGNGNVSECLPLRYNTTLDQWTTHCNMVQAEDMGLLKMDILGLKTLSILTDMVRSIFKNTGKRIDIRTLPFLPDNLVKEIIKRIYAEANTIGIFQFESTGIRQVLRQILPATLKDIILINALYRPGPLEYAEVVAKVKNGLMVAPYKHPMLKPILGETYGVMIYQEQVMEVCRKLAGFSLADADNIRRFMSKKKFDYLEKERQVFIYGNAERNIVGCESNGISPEIANAIFDDMIEFAKYAFNKSHAAIYGFTSFYTAWGKFTYPAEFYASVMNHAKDADELGVFVRDANLYNINNKKVKVFPPYINKADVHFVGKEDSVTYGLQHIKGFDANLSNIIINERTANGPYKDFFDFILRVKISAKKAKKLVLAGVFDEFTTLNGHSCSRKSLANDIFLEKVCEISETIAKKKKYIEEGNLVLSLINSGKATRVSDLDSYNLKEFKITSKTDTFPSISKLEARVSSAEEMVSIKKEALYKMYIPSATFTANEKTEFLTLERELLGFYVSSHPIEHYEVQTSPIREINKETNTVTGIITDLKTSEKGTISFLLEDLTGTIKCYVYKNNVSRLKGSIDLIKEGNAIIINKLVSEKEFLKRVEQDITEMAENPESSDDEEEVIEKYFVFELNREDHVSQINHKEESYILRTNYIDFEEVEDVLNEFVLSDNTDKSYININIFFDDIKEYRVFNKKVSENFLMTDTYLELSK